MTANPTLLTMPLAQNGQKNVIPATQATAGDGLFSQSTGFPAETSLPLGAGGVAPSREDFNGAFNLMGGILFMVQKGWRFEFDENQSYYTGCIVRDTDDGKLYECLNDVAASSTHPSTDATNWKEFGVDASLFANTDLSNLTQTGEKLILDINSPDYANGVSWTYTTGGTEQSYSATSNGFLSYEITSVAMQEAFIKIDGVKVITFASRGTADGSRHAVTSGMIWVPDGATVSVSSYDADPGSSLTFFPAKEAI